jgi:hypothetical protein
LSKGELKKISKEFEKKGKCSIMKINKDASK